MVVRWAALVTFSTYAEALAPLCCPVLTLLPLSCFDIASLSKFSTFSLYSVSNESSIVCNSLTSDLVWAVLRLLRRRPLASSRSKLSIFHMVLFLCGLNSACNCVMACL
uniref:Secreted protein n=1 Tax=Cacopsylla melanoneura TaxID=428564 RepID=A0A8D8Z804_9HEMI